MKTQPVLWNGRVRNLSRRFRKRLRWVMWREKRKLYWYWQERMEMKISVSEFCAPVGAATGKKWLDDFIRERRVEGGWEK